MKTEHVIEAEKFCSRWLPWLFAAGILLLVVRLGAAPIYILDEAKNAQCAREMWWWQRWEVPTFNGMLRTDKPPLHYGFMSIAYSLFGVGAWQARLFSALAGIGLLFIFYYWVRRWASQVLAFTALAGLICSVHWLFEFRLAVPDPYLLFFTCGGLFAAFHYIQTRSTPWLLLAAISLGLAILAKGPVALALPGLVVFIYVIWQKKWDALANGWLVAAALLLLLVAAPWYWFAHTATGGAFTQGFFFDHNINRFAGAMEGHGAPFFVTVVMAVVGMLPLSVLAIISLHKRHGYWQQPLYRFSAIAAGVFLIFFSISSTKLPNYAMPCYPFIAVMAGFYLSDVLAGAKKIPSYAWWVWLFFAIAIPGAAYFAIVAEEAIAHLYYVAFFLLVLPALLWWAYRSRSRVFTALPRFGLAWCMFGAVLLWVGYPTLYRHNPVELVFEKLPAEYELLAFGLYNPAVNFRQADHFQSIIQEFEDPAVLKRQLGLRTEGLFSGKQLPVFVVTRKEYLPQLVDIPLTLVAEQKDLFELPTTVLLKYTP